MRNIVHIAAGHTSMMDKNRYKNTKSKHVIGYFDD